jgi:mono/diheme cytochrome c family protein
MTRLRAGVGWLAVILALLAAAGCGPAAAPTAGGTQGPPLPTLAAEEAARGAAVYRGNCAACHGLRAEGHPDYGKKRDGEHGLYPPPPHDATGHTWHHGDATLFRIISEGGQSYAPPGFTSRMPAFKGYLSEGDIRAVIVYFKSLWGERERRFQAEVTANEGA